MPDVPGNRQPPDTGAHPLSYRSAPAATPKRRVSKSGLALVLSFAHALLTVAFLVVGVGIIPVRGTTWRIALRTCLVLSAPGRWLLEWPQFQGVDGTVRLSLLILNSCLWGFGLVYGYSLCRESVRWALSPEEQEQS